MAKKQFKNYKYKPLFTTGQTIVEVDEGSDGRRHEFGKSIVIGTHIELGKYSNLNSDVSDNQYDQHDSAHTIYCTYVEPETEGDTGYTNWVWEHHAELACSNVKKGKRILRDSFVSICADRAVKEDKKIRKFWRLLKENRTDPN